MKKKFIYYLTLLIAGLSFAQQPQQGPAVRIVGEFTSNNIVVFGEGRTIKDSGSSFTTLNETLNTIKGSGSSGVLTTNLNNLTLTNQLEHGTITTNLNNLSYTNTLEHGVIITNYNNHSNNNTFFHGLIGSNVAYKTDMITSIMYVGTTATVASNFYVLSSGTNWLLACATNANTVSGLIGYSLGNNSSSGMQLGGNIYIQGLTVGKQYVATNAGACTAIAPTNAYEFYRAIGYATSTTNLYFAPSQFYLGF